KGHGRGPIESRRKGPEVRQEQDSFRVVDATTRLRVVAGRVDATIVSRHGSSGSLIPTVEAEHLEKWHAALARDWRVGLTVLNAQRERGGVDVGFTQGVDALDLELASGRPW